MPKPFFIRRPSGLFVRFLVPVYAREAVGSRFLIRSLGDLRDDAARLAAARLGYALSQQFKALRGCMAKQGKQPRPVVIRTDGTGNEVSRYSVEIAADGSRKISAEGAEDHARAMEAWRALDPQNMADLTAIFAVPASSDGARAATAHTPPSALPQLMLEERTKLFLTQFSRKQRASNTVHDTTHTLRLFVDIIGDKPLAAIGPEDMDRWLDAMAHYPPNATKLAVYKDLSPRDVVALAKRTKVAPISLRTREKHLDRLRVFFNWAVARRDLDRNPCASLHVMTREQEDSQTRRSFTPAELAKIFDPELRTKVCRTPAQWWLPAMALYTGARSQELAQLHLQDIEEVSGIWGFHIATRFDGQRLKNRQSKRFVPIHPALREAGFLDFVEDVRRNLGDGYLFSELGNRPGDTLGDWFNRTYLKNHCGIEGQVFHCFRHSFITAADRAGVPDHRIARITGHSQGTSVLRGHYIDTPTLSERAAAVTSVLFEPVTLTVYSSDSFAAFFDKMRRQQRRATAVENRKARQKNR